MNKEGYFNVLLQAIADKIKTDIPEFKDVGVFAGGFNGVSDAKKFTTLAPSLRVGLSGLSYNVNAESGQLISTMDLSLVFITKDNKIPNSRHGIALDFLEKVLLLVKDGSWGVENTYATDKKSVTARNYWGAELMETGIAMWLVSWKQDAILGQDAWLPDNKYGL